jgi:predicted nuclease with TOPRIM domain
MGDERDLDNEYHIRYQIAQESYGMMMNAVDEAFELSRQRLADKEELKRLRMECEKQQREIDRLSTEFDKANKNFVEMISQQTAKITEERDRLREERDMWKKSYEDLVKCV